MRRVEVLGPARIDGEALTSPTQRLVLAVLAASTPDAVPFHRLIDAVWSEDPPPSAENSLHSHLTRLRKALGPGALLRDGHSYRLVAPTDIDDFRSAAEAATSAVPEERDGSGARSQRDRLERALRSWRGRPFDDCGDHPFLLAASDALTGHYCQVVRALASLDLADGNAVGAAARARQLAAEHPLDEQTWALLVDALAAGGRRTEALRAVQEAQTALAAVGLEPSPVLREAEAAVLRDRPSTELAIPLARTRLIGRDELMEAIADRVSQPGWTTLVGPGGVGKTRLAIEIASAEAGSGAAERVAFVDLSEVEAAEVEVAVARAVGASLRPPYLERIVDRLASVDLLVLDCCELVAGAVAELGSTLIDRCQGSQGRARMGERSEHHPSTSGPERPGPKGQERETGLGTPSGTMADPLGSQGRARMGERSEHHPSTSRPERPGPKGQERETGLGTPSGTMADPLGSQGSARMGERSEHHPSTSRPERPGPNGQERETGLGTPGGTMADPLGSLALRVLATSRAPLHLDGERLIDVTPLDDHAAVELVRARCADAGVALPGVDAVAELCRAVDCLPLNLELLVGALRHLSPDELQRAVSEPLAVLGGPGQLAESVGRSVDGLDPAARASFEQLSVLRSPFVLATAHGCMQAEDEATSIAHLRALRERSLLASVDTPAGRRLRMLDTIRAVARRGLERSGEHGAASSRHVEVFDRRAREVDRGLRSCDEVEWLDVAEIELADLRAAHRQAIAAHDIDASMSIPASMFHLVYDRLRTDLAAWADASLGAFGFDHPQAPLVGAVAALGAMHVDDHDRAGDLIDRARRASGSGARHAALVDANLALRSGDLARTIGAATEVVELSLADGDEYTATIGHLLCGLGAFYGGDQDAAFDAVDRTRRSARAVGAPTLLAYADYVEGEVRSELEPEVALEYLHRAYRRASACRSALAEGVSLVTITTIRARSDDPRGAASDFGAAIRHWRERGDWNLQWSTLRNFVEFLVRTGLDEPAIVIVGAITAHGPPSYGVESRRFDDAFGLAAERSGPQLTQRLLAQGRSLTSDELLDHALAATPTP